MKTIKYTDVYYHPCDKMDILFTWDIRKAAANRKRMFYNKLFGFGHAKVGKAHRYPGVLEQIPRKSWKRVGGSVYVIEEKYASGLGRLLKNFEDVLEWHEFKIIQKM